jgi:undecaprenyl-phosphate 4-deoxy-4-formamido-L-arabinose transferase
MPTGQLAQLSIVIPIFNEEDNLVVLLDRLQVVLESIPCVSEIICINDGSADQSLSMLLRAQANYSNLMVVDFQKNYGQHMAILAGFELAHGDWVITIDADLQNPPESIPAILEALQQGYDWVGTYRLHRKDPFYRKCCSQLINALREKISAISMRDQGCMLRGYHRSIVDQIVTIQDPCTFIPALAFQLAARTIELPIPHSARYAGVSKYNLYRLVRLNFDLITGTSLFPLQALTLFGGLVSCISFLFVIYLVMRRLILGPEAEGVFTLFAGLFFLISLLIMSVGIAGEYIGRIFLNVSQKPNYVVRKIHPALACSTKVQNSRGIKIGRT